MQAIYDLSSFVTLTYTQADRELRSALRFSTAMVAGTLFLSLPMMEAGKDAPVEMQALEDSQADLSLAEVVNHLQDRLPREQKAEAYKLGKLLMALADRHMVSPGLILSVIETESSYRAGVVSKSGAIGMMQLLPTTAEEVAKRYGVRAYRTQADLYDPAINMRLGVAYLAYLRSRFGNSLHYLAAYNMGPTAMKRRLNRGEYSLGALEGYVRKIQTRTLDIRKQTDGRPQVVTRDRLAVL